MTGLRRWGQVGWLGQTGRVYSLDDDPSQTERGGFSPLWLLLEDEAPVPPEDVADDAVRRQEQPDA